MSLVMVPRCVETNSQPAETNSCIAPQIIHKNRQSFTLSSDSIFIAESTSCLTPSTIVSDKPRELNHDIKIIKQQAMPLGNLQTSFILTILRRGKTLLFSTTQQRYQRVDKSFRNTPVKARKKFGFQPSRFTAIRPKYSTTLHISEHSISQQNVSQHNRYTFGPRSQLHSPTSALFPSDTLPTAYLPTISMPPDSDIAQLWDLVRVTLAQRPQENASTMSSSSATLQYFKHTLKGVTPAKVPLPGRHSDIENKCNELQLNFTYSGNTLYGAPLNYVAQQSNNVAKSLTQTSNAGQEILNFFFQNRAENTLTWSVSPTILANNDKPVPSLDKLSLQLVRDVIHRRIDPKRKQSKSTLSLGLNLRALFYDSHGVPCGYVQKTLRDLTTEDGCFADFLHVQQVIEDSKQIDRARKHWARHAQEAIWLQLSIERFNKTEDKEEVLRNTGYCGYIIHGAAVELWWMKPLPPNLSQSPESRSSTVSFWRPSLRNLSAKSTEHQPRFECEMYGLGTLNLTKGEDVTQMVEFNNALLRWGQAKRYESHAVNLWNICWRKDKDEPPATMSPSAMEKYWDSSYISRQQTT